MKYSLPFALMISACVPSEPATQQKSISGSSIPINACEGAAKNNCAFVNGPVKLSSKEIRLPARKFPFYPTQERLEFVDSKRSNWVAPANTLTDGASIPPIFVRIIGDPKSREFINAATVHDAYCGTGNETHAYYHAAKWQDVHRMFYDALRVGGTPQVKAKVMFAAVYLGGPRWDGARKVNNRIVKSSKNYNLRISSKGQSALSRKGQANKSLQDMGVPEKTLVAKLKEAKAFIETKNPAIHVLESFLIAQEAEMFSAKKNPVKVNEPVHSGSGH